MLLSNFNKRILNRFRVRVKQKNKTWYMYILNTFAWIAGYKTFMQRPMTIYNTIYIIDSLPPKTCIHELTHVLQTRSTLFFYLKYLFSQKFRLLMEIEAFLIAKAFSNLIAFGTIRRLDLLEYSEKQLPNILFKEYGIRKSLYTYVCIVCRANAILLSEKIWPVILKEGWELWQNTK